MRALDLVALEKDGETMHSVVLEPQGVLRLYLPSHDKRSTVFLNMDGVIYDPDVLSKPFDKPQWTAVFPAGNFEKPERKGLVKDVMMYTWGGGCACWLQKRLVCRRQAGGAYACDQFKRSVRIQRKKKGKAGAKERWGSNGDLPSGSTWLKCSLEDGKPSWHCMTFCTDRLLAL